MMLILIVIIFSIFGMFFRLLIAGSCGVSAGAVGGEHDNLSNLLPQIAPLLGYC